MSAPHLSPAPPQSHCSIQIILYSKSHLTTSRLADTITWSLLTGLVDGPLSSFAGLAQAAPEFFATYGIPEQLASDGSLMSYETQKCLADYSVKHRLSSVAFAQSNKWAELGVKSMKREERTQTGTAA